MKRRAVEGLLFFFIICCNNALLYSREFAFISSETAGHDVKPLMEEKQLNKNVSKSHERTFKGSHEALHLRDDVQEEKKVITGENKKGKGTYGGGDLLRPRSKKEWSKLVTSKILFPPLSTTA